MKEALATGLLILAPTVALLTLAALALAAGKLRCVVRAHLITADVAQAASPSLPARRPEPVPDGHPDDAVPLTAGDLAR